MILIDRFRPSGKNAEEFIVMPNRAMNRRALVTVFLVMAAVTLSIGTMFFWQGVTLILPFSGLEVLLMGAGLYITAWRGGLREVILITDDMIQVERGHRELEEVHSFQRAWAKIVLERSWNSWYPSRLLLRSHGQQIETGHFLNEQERQGLARLLCSAANLDLHK